MRVAFQSSAGPAPAPPGTAPPRHHTVPFGYQRYQPVLPMQSQKERRANALRRVLSGGRSHCTETNLKCELQNTIKWLRSDRPRGKAPKRTQRGESPAALCALPRGRRLFGQQPQTRTNRSRLGPVPLAAAPRAVAAPLPLCR